MSRSPSPVVFRQQQAGFVRAANRERCQNCAHVEAHRNGEVMSFSCHPVGGFVSAWSICKHWTKKGTTPA